MDSIQTQLVEALNLARAEIVKLYDDIKSEGYDHTDQAVLDQIDAALAFARGELPVETSGAGC